MLVAQHRCPRAFQRRVTGSQIRLAATRPITPAIVLCSVTPSSRIAPPTSAASTAVPAIARANLRVAGQAPVVRLGCPEPTSSAAVPTGAPRIPASTSAASTDRPSLPRALTALTSGDNYPQCGAPTRKRVRTTGSSPDGERGYPAAGHARSAYVPGGCAPLQDG